MIKSNFYTTLFLPGCKKTVKINEINNYYYLDILKFIQNNNFYDFNDFLDKIITDHTDSNIEELTCIDKFCILVEMRSISIGNTIDFYINNTHIKYNLSDICKNIQSLDDKSHNIQLNELDIEINLPNNFIIDEKDDIIRSCIKKINDLRINSLSETEKILIYNALPASLYDNIKQFVIENNNYYREKNIFSMPNFDEYKNFRLQPFNTSFIEFIKSIYNDNLTSFYDLQFNLITKMNISYDHFMSMTFNESRMYIAMQNKEIKRQEDKQKKSQGNLPL